MRRRRGSPAGTKFWRADGAGVDPSGLLPENPPYPSGGLPRIFAAMALDSVKVPKLSLTQTLFGLFLRLVSVSCFWFGLNYWAMLIGFSFEGSGRFDLLPVPWRTAATVLAVVYPVAALGLWLLVSWGPVLWVAAAAIEVLMFAVYPEVFGAKPMLLVLHAAVAFIFVLFRAAIVFQRVRQARAARIDLP
ncbi:DUF6163 family protein [Rhizobium sp. Root482]|uniref:DUF6163 family protein n=1 Tax=Rhizobium sp. Root482 TaxID=1736543 RepID=UPI000AF0F373|nr:DUF6163 family protein [Rhizobium sp. Root482]